MYNVKPFATLSQPSAKAIPTHLIQTHGVVGHLLSLVMTHSFEPGALEKGNIPNMQARGVASTRVEKGCLKKGVIG